MLASMNPNRAPAQFYINVLNLVYLVKKIANTANTDFSKANYSSYPISTKAQPIGQALSEYLMIAGPVVLM